MVKANGRNVKIKPIQNRVVVRQDIVEDKSAGGILLTGGAIQKPNRGIVLFTGLGKITENGKRIPMDLKVGDTIYWAQVFGIKVKTASGEELVVLKEDEVLFSIEEIG